MSYQLSERSLQRLQGVHPKLVAIVKRAIEISTQDFMVLEGVRSKEQCMINYGKGRTASQCLAKGIPAKYAKPNEAKVTWLNHPLASKHSVQADGLGHAVDLVPSPLDWNDLKKFDAIQKAMFTVAKEQGVTIRWGANWDGDGNYREKGETDNPHFEI